MNYTGNAIGRTFNSLTIVAVSEKTRSGWLFECKCLCSNTRISLLSNLKSNKVKSCKACAKQRQISHNKTIGKCIGSLTKTHGLSKQAGYNSWSALKNRCDNPNLDNYIHYGGRGITYCEAWRSFETFWQDMQSTWFVGATIDRIDNDGSYCKENCQWLTRSAHAIKSNNERRQSNEL